MRSRAKAYKYCEEKSSNLIYPALRDAHTEVLFLFSKKAEAVNRPTAQLLRKQSSQGIKNSSIFSLENILLSIRVYTSLRFHR